MSDLDIKLARKKKAVFWLGLICLLLFLFWQLLEICTITDFEVSGNRHYTSAQIRRMVESGWFGDNTIMVSLKYNHRNAFIVGPVNGRGNRRNLVGGYNQQVNSCPDKTVNLLDLALIAIVCCGKAQIHVIVEIGADLQFRVLLVSPDVVRALRHPDAVLFRVLRA